MLITTQTESKHRNYYSVFDTSTGLQYVLSTQKEESSINMESVLVCVVSPSTSEIENGILYREQEAIDFWNQLKRLDDKTYVDSFFIESLNKAIQTLEQLKGNENEN